MGFLERVGFSGKSTEEPSKGEAAFVGGKKFNPDDVPFNVAEGMPLEELKQVIDDAEETIEYIKQNNPADNPEVQYIVSHYEKLKEIYQRRSSAYEDREAA